MSAQRLSGGLFLSAGRAGTWLLPVLIGLCGCARSPSRSIAHSWQDSSKIQWSRVPDAHSENKAGESKVAANTPAGDALKNDANVFGRFRTPTRKANGKSSEISSDERAIAQARPRSGPHDPFQDDERVAARPASKRKAAAPQASETAESQVVTARDRLRATLSDDTRRRVVQVADTGEDEQLRLRIESLMNRAKAHCEEGELLAARRAADLAHSLAESSGLEFDPDVERPIELLTFIRSRLDEEAAEEKLRLAEAQDAEDSEVEMSAEGPAPTEGSLPAVRPGKRRFPFDAASPFDPYAQDVSLAHLHDEEDEQIFGPSMVVLESPSFEEDADVSPIAYSRTTDRKRPNHRRFSLTPREDSVPANAEDIPSPPVEPAAADEDIALPEPDVEVAPSPPWSEPDGPSLGAMIPAEDGADSAAAADDKASVEDRELRPASAWPRWMPYSLLSALTAGFCTWLWSRRKPTLG